MIISVVFVGFIMRPISQSDVFGKNTLKNIESHFFLSCAMCKQQTSCLTLFRTVFLCNLIGTYVNKRRHVVFMGFSMLKGGVFGYIFCPCAMDMRDWSQSIDCTVNLSLIKHYNLEAKIQSMLPTQCAIWTCLALSWSTAKILTNEGDISNTKIHKHVVHPQIVQHSQQYVFFGTFWCCGDHVRCKLSTQGKYAFQFITSSLFDAFWTVRFLFCKYFYFTPRFSVAYVWLSKLKAWLLEKFLAMLLKQLDIEY